MAQGLLYFQAVKKFLENSENQKIYAINFLNYVLKETNVLELELKGEALCFLISCINIIGAHHEDVKMELII